MPKPGDLATAHQRRLTDRELRFIEEYCVDLEPGPAARRAGIAANDPALANTQGNKLLRIPEVMEAIDVRLRELSRRAVSNATYVRERLTEVVERCMQKEQVMERQINPETGKTELMPTGEWAFNAQGANKALELLGRHHGMFADKVIVTIERELKAMPQLELDARIRRITEELQAIDMMPGADGVYEAVPVAAIPMIEKLPTWTPEEE